MVMSRGSVHLTTLFPWASLTKRLRLKKNIALFLGPFFLKTDAAGRLFILIFIQQKTDAGTFFSEIQTIFSDIIQVRP